MATLKRRSSASAAVTKSAIAQASTMLQTLPEKPRDNWSLREAVNLLHDSIIAALDRGYSHEEVATMLADKGVKITAASLKRYLASVKREKNSSKSKTSRGGRRSKTAAFESVTLAKPKTSTQSAPSIAPSKEKPKATPKTSPKKTAEPAARTKAASATPAASRTGGRSRKSSGGSK